MRAEKKDVSAESAGGGVSWRWVSVYACRVCAGTEEMRERRSAGSVMSWSGWGEGVSGGGTGGGVGVDGCRW